MTKNVVSIDNIVTCAGLRGFGVRERGYGRLFTACRERQWGDSSSACATAPPRTGGLLVHSISATRPVVLTCTGLFLCVTLTVVIQAQEPLPDTTDRLTVVDGALHSPLIKETSPRPIAAVNAFVEGSSQTADATIEIRLGSSRLLTFKQPLAKPGGENPVIAFSDPGVADFEVLPTGRTLRMIGLRPGNSDLSITTSEGQTYSFLVRVNYDLDIIRTTVKEQFPSASVSITQLRNHVILSGQTRSAVQTVEIEATVRSLLPAAAAAADVNGGNAGPGGPVDFPIVNLLQVPGPQQVMLRVQVAELNRTAMREIGASFLFSDANSIVTSPVGGAQQVVGGVQDSSLIASGAGLTSILTTVPAATTAAIGIFDSANFSVLFRALRENNFMKILAEPNLVSLNGHDATFLAGGEFPIAVPQQNGVNTVEFRRFGVNLDFTPTILPDDTIRLRVAPEVSSLDFAIGVTLTPGASPIPGLNSRSADTTVELREGQTLMLAGLLQVELSAQTQRIPGLGDMPILGTFFRNSTSRSVEKELVVMVTPYIVEALDKEDTIPLPGDDIHEANEKEFFLYGRVEGCASGFRSTTDYPRCRELIGIENRFVHGPHGYSDCNNCR